MEKVKGKFPFSELLTKESTEPNTTGNRCIDTRTHIPGFLKDLVNQKLGLWVRNAFQALRCRRRINTLLAQMVSAQWTLSIPVWWSATRNGEMVCSSP